MFMCQCIVSFHHPSGPRLICCFRPTLRSLRALSFPPAPPNFPAALSSLSLSSLPRSFTPLPSKPDEDLLPCSVGGISCRKVVLPFRPGAAG